ncbi:hypothetical protein Q3H59_004570 [Pantoea sp. SORGH_AS 659]|jgi:hypothetical protein|nr:hypothetical protein [Pantoea sp. SORGH_AS_0659]
MSSASMITEINGDYRHFGMPRTIKLMHNT